MAELRMVKLNDLLGMTFNIPDYQRGYRWEPQQVTDLLEDIDAFISKKPGAGEIYCIQPLVIAPATDENEPLQECRIAESLDAIRSILEKYKGRWTVVDGQQRLTTIFLILKYLKIQKSFIIKYSTRDKSEQFLQYITSDNADKEANNNIDYYHMYRVYNTVCEWFKSKEGKEEDFKTTLLNRVCFIWYQIEHKDEIPTFTRLNINKIPLTDAELIKALFLNRKNFDTDSGNADARQRERALVWDQIEHDLQNDEFWLFLHEKGYSKPTRIDYILDMICNQDLKEKTILYMNTKSLRNGRNNKNKTKAENHNDDLNKRIGCDEHKTFRYFNEAFKEPFKTDNKPDELWKEIEKYHRIFIEWYQDYRLYHYIGYLTTVKGQSVIPELIKEWENKTKNEFADEVKKRIKNYLQTKKRLKLDKGLDDLKNIIFDQDDAPSKTECVDLLLLHNVETIVRQNEKLVNDTKYNLPNFSKFPFHLFKQENWQVEHIRPNAGDDFNDDAKRLYLWLAKEYVDQDTKNEIEEYINTPENGKSFEELLDKILKLGNGNPLSDEDKNKICNFVLLDETTNKEYGNQIFPVKRRFLANKEQGYKVEYAIDKEGKPSAKRSSQEIAFVPPCTKNVFAKFYTTAPATMLNWNGDDAEAYWKDIEEKLEGFLLSSDERG